MDDTSTSATITELMFIFSRYGIPESLKAGPQWSAVHIRRLKGFCEEYDIWLVHSIPYWPQMNGEVERRNRSILKRLRIAQELDKDWRKELRQYLLMYHAANHTTTGKPPSELMFGRNTTSLENGTLLKKRGRLYSAYKKRRAKPSGLQVGDRVLAKRTRKGHKLCADFSPETFDVVQRSGADVTIRSTKTGKEFRRNAAHLKALPREESNGNDPIEDATSSESGLELDGAEPTGNATSPKPGLALASNRHGEGDRNPEGASGGFRRASTSKRTKVEPKYFKDFVTY
ncbi:uncharacterized protein LOC129728705 [Wyeomyia smithii]|uniref:uncharacterized protein LOC129728705 n=1 Tax=Wyeomyia smithii TaxID=174621 RepID=UPI00246812BC|nr:uncharacterized protein LOC129728705 [Wyeomyia smithii]